MTANSKWTIAVLVSLGLGVAFGRYLTPANVKIKTQEVIKHDVVTVVKTITRPDGTKETETRTENRTEIAKSTDKQVIALKPQWKISATTNLIQGPGQAYGLSVERRIIGPIFAGGYFRSDGIGGASIGIEF